MSYTREANNLNKQNPGELLFHHLFSKCKTDADRDTAIGKIIATKNGYQTIVSAMTFAIEIDNKLYAKEDELFKQQLMLTLDDYESVYWDDDCEDLICTGGKGGEIQSRINEISHIHNLVEFSIIPQLNKALDKHKTDQELELITELSEQFDSLRP